MTRAGIWDNPAGAKEKSQELALLEEQTGLWQDLLSKVGDLQEVIDLLKEEKDQQLLAELKKGLGELDESVKKNEFKLLLSGSFDANNAILAIHAGTGGVDAMDWAEMLLRMYLRFAEKKGYRTKILDISRGEEAGIKSVTVDVHGGYAYGNLKSEFGVHRLVRQSPFNSDSLRQTSFALAEVLPEIAESKAEPIDPKDLKMDMYRSGGAGGQNVNKTSTAVRLTHIPTGLVAASQSERSQVQNRENALRVLRAKLALKREQEKKAEKQKLRGEYQSAEWGNQIRSYVLHPYQLVKDHRTKVESKNAQAVLDGALSPFVGGYLNWRAKCDIDRPLPKKSD